MVALLIKNRRMKISPGGVITLTVAARKTLKMSRGEGSHLTVAVDGDTVCLAPAGGPGATRVSPKGQMELIGDARALLESGLERHYWLELHDDRQIVVIHPYR